MSNSIELWDLDYNKFGLHNSQNESVKIPGLTVSDDNTNPDGLKLFVEKLFVSEYEGVTLASMFDMVILKSCYTGSRIRSDKRLAAFIEAGKKTIEMLNEKQYPALILTPIPDSPFYSSSKTAARAASYANCVSGEIDGQGAVRVVNLHKLLADGHGFLSSELRKFAGLDPHPNTTGINKINTIICSELAPFVTSSVTK
jgi:hypothetical protein